MNETTIQIKVDEHGVINLQALAPCLAVAMRTATEYVQGKWIEAATHGIGSLPPTGDEYYVTGIDAGAEYPYEGDFLTGRVANYSPTARRVEDGYASFDMKPGLLHGSQARRSRDGTLYNIVPFRWGTPRQSPHEAGRGDQRATLQSMPDEVYDVARKLKQSRRAGSYFVPSVHADQPLAMRQVYEYEWGGHLRRSDIPSEYLAVRQPWHKASPWEGMYRFEAGENTRRTYSHYITFRAVSEKSDPRAWIHPGVKPKPYSKAVVAAEAENVRQLVKRIVAEGMEG